MWYIKEKYMIKNMEIRELKKFDYYLEYFELLSQLSEIKKCSLEVFLFYLENIKKNNNHKIFVIEENDKIIGNITVILEQNLLGDVKKVGHIEDVVVHKDYRGKGLARKLLNFAENYCKNNCYKNYFRLF